MPVTLDPRLLPETAQQLVELLGVEPALVLIRALGGVRVHIPKHFSKGHKLTALLGEDAAKVLMDMYAGEALVVPKCEQLIRYQQVKALLDAGTPAGQIALATGYTERHIYKIRQELNQNQAQQSWDF